MRFPQIVHLRQSLVWLLTLCMVGQSLGSAQGLFLCLGCKDVAGGIAVVSQPCEAGDCCQKRVIIVHCEEDHDHDQDVAFESVENCDCLDVKLPPSQGACVRTGAKALDNHVAGAVAIHTPLVILLPAPVTPAAHGIARAGPAFVPQLLPDTRHTVLRI